jgi:hypothetical protein
MCLCPAASVNEEKFLLPKDHSGTTLLLAQSKMDHIFMHIVVVALKKPSHKVYLLNWMQTETLSYHQNHG